jgi:ribosomal-protein-alanine N-acetyltransferase
VSRFPVSAEICEIRGKKLIPGFLVSRFVFIGVHSWLKNMKVILETDRLLLREYVEEDAEAFFKLNSDPEVLRFVPDKALLNVEQARQLLIDHPIADYRKYGFGRGACILKSTGEQIGFAGLKYLEELGEVDVAFRLMRTHWGLGLATEAALASVRFGFADLGLKRIIGLVMPENIASVRVLEKTGLRYVETVSFWGHQFSKYIIDAQQRRSEC